MQITTREFLRQLGLGAAVGLAARSDTTPLALDRTLLRKTLAAQGVCV